ncbi:SGNH/GDSL hydrolase family protein [Nocardia arizonensis]|uniref:SGNH/GDSL hydrolase family protein n=1 Tax=Nocardia arizonensis TaxID=1141647 RepID=UPI000A9ACD01|nr:SGNH/GDSL hydrolase family protein [Nocardia arizonensis]
MSDIAIRTEADDPMLIADDTARELLEGAPWRRFAVIGDSLALGVGDPSPGYRAVGWSDRLAEILTSVRPDLAYLNTGRVGATVEQVIDRQLEAVLEFRPDLVHIGCGGNDLFLPDGLDSLAERLDTLFAAVHACGAQIFAFTIADVWETERMAPMRSLRDRMAILNGIVGELSARYGVLLVEFWNHPLRLRPDLMSEDLIHFTTSGHAVVTTEVVRALSGLLPAG